MNSRMVALLALAQEQGIKIAHVGVDRVMILDDDWAEFENSDDNEPYMVTKLKRNHKLQNKKSQNNDWRKDRGFNGYHREF